MGMESEEIGYERASARDQSEVEREITTLEELESRLSKVLAQHRERIGAYLRNEVSAEPVARVVTEAPRTQMGERLAALRERVSGEIASLSDMTSLFEG